MKCWPHGSSVAGVCLSPPDKTYISIGALDALYKSILSLGYHFKQKYGKHSTFAFPAPGFAVVNWQVEVSGLKLLNIQTQAENHFKLTYDMLKSRAG